MPNTQRTRRGRVSEPQCIYLLTTRTAQRQRFFLDWHAARSVASALHDAGKSGQVSSLAWVVMPDHFHWLVQLRTGSLASVMRNVKARAAIYTNRHLGREGRVWQSGYHDRALRREEDLAAVARYIVCNPLRAGLVRQVGDYAFWDAVWL